METDRKKFTFRYGGDIEAMLNKALENASSNSLNKLIENCIFDALEKHPKEFKRLNSELNKASDEIKALKQKNTEIYRNFSELQRLILEEKAIKDKIDKLLEK